jgi:hypothetical protein
MPSPAGWREVPCVECETFVEGIDFGERCRSCRARREQRVAVIARRSALVATAATGAWVLSQPPASPTAQWTGIIAVPATYLLVHVIVGRLAMELLP